MIIPMHKYGFLVYHREYDNFLNDMQQHGVLHIIEKEHTSSTDFLLKTELVNRIEKTIQFLETRETMPGDLVSVDDVLKIVEEIAEKQIILESLNNELDTTQQELQKTIPWGDFSTEIITKLKADDLHVRFFILPKKKFTSQFQEKYHAEIISESQRDIYFIIIQKGYEQLNIDTSEVMPPEKSLSELKKHIIDIENKITLINNEFDNFASTAIPLLRKEKEAIQTSVEFDQVIWQTQKEFEGKLMILEGWVPLTKKMQIDDYLNNNKVLFIAEKATPKDNAPILLQNDRFSKLFEPIGKLFSLPSYFELDLTVFFAPFFMLFFGFCLGDAGYGLLFIVGASIYKIKAPKHIKPYLSLIQFLGIATFILGFISGTFFGINLIEADFNFTDRIRSLFLDPNSMFNLALLLGAAQIIFGLFIKAANQVRQYGLIYALGTFGWLVILIGGSIYMLLTKQEIIAPNKYILQAILIFGGFFILLFSDPEGGIFSRIGKGLWNIYATITGIFGDLLSYLRLFALGLSSAILGFVVNEIALEMLHASPVIGPVLFIIILLLGHTLNIMISSLGSFVHPMRLTFVEFFKNAGFTGGGKAYKPFMKYNNI